MAWRGQLSKNIKELRFLMCQSSSASASARAFVEKNYKELKTLNPKLPILIRECSGVEPQLWARYDLGVEKAIKLEGLSEAQISKALENLEILILIDHGINPWNPLISNAWRSKSGARRHQVRGLAPNDTVTMPNDVSEAAIYGN
ncbi:NADH dehydrogenase [Vigna unguiculata]|uniref:NADH dehydrogenase n=1 Tax=Vigna unguiculata TaxID=3917 RepID=A0A4D6NJ71_VIGUN|nr:NADH dehydrogenase [Vigna unguiculata]